MIFESVQFNNIEELYDAVYTSLTNEELKKDIGSKLVNIYNRCSVVFNIKDITPFELFYLKKIANDNVIIDPGYHRPKMSFSTPIEEAVSSFTQLWNRISKDTDLSEEYRQGLEREATTYMPISFYVKDITVIFTGSSLFHLFGTMPSLFFKDIYSNMDKLPEKFIENEMMVDRISQILINDLYKLIASDLNNVDMIPEGIAFNDYYKSIKDSVGHYLSHAITPFGIIGISKLSEENADTVENSGILLDEYDSKIIPNFKTFDDENKHHGIFFKTTKLVYVITLPVLAFLEFYNNIPSSFLTDIMNLRIVSWEDAHIEPIEIPAKYVTRFEKRYSDYILAYNSITKEQQLHRLIHMPADKTVSFILTLSLEDISHSLVLYERELTDRISGNGDSIKHNIMDMLEYIKNTSRIVYNQFMF